MQIACGIDCREETQETMARKALQRILSVCVLAILTAALCLGQNNAALIGKWNMTSESGGDPVLWTLVLKESDGKLTGLLTTNAAERPAKDFKYEAGAITFKAPYQGEDYEIQLTLKSDKLDGTWRGGGDTGRTSGTKAQ